MNTFNHVFLAIKEYCNTTGEVAKEDCFNYIAKHSNVPLDNLDFYLNTLQELGIIKYSWNDKTIFLTKFGYSKDKLFA